MVDLINICSLQIKDFDVTGKALQKLSADPGFVIDFEYIQENSCFVLPRFVFSLLTQSYWSMLITCSKFLIH